MRVTLIVLAAVGLAGCASAPRSDTAKRPVEDWRAGLTDRTTRDMGSGRARELALQALSHIGTPYRYGGTSPQTGFDCSGLVYYIYSRGAGIALPRTTEGLSEIGTPVDIGELETGDLVFFDTLRKPYSHVGIYLGDQRFIHAPTSGGQVEIVDLRAQYWQARFSGARRPAL
jgi:cell wall-associated NlpC family hydrolase